MKDDAVLSACLGPPPVPRDDVVMAACCAPPPPRDDVIMASCMAAPPVPVPVPSAPPPVPFYDPLAAPPWPRILAPSLRQQRQERMNPLGSGGWRSGLSVVQEDFPRQTSSWG